MAESGQPVDLGAEHLLLLVEPDGGALDFLDGHPAGTGVGAQGVSRALRSSPTPAITRRLQGTAAWAN